MIGGVFDRLVERVTVRRFERASWIVFVGVTLYFVITHAGYHLIDLSVYRYGGDLLLHGVDPYTGRASSGLPFTYPPFAGIVFAPISLLPDVVARALITAAGMACLLAIARMLQRRLRPDLLVWWPALLASSILVFSEPIRETLRFGQVNLMLTALVMADVWRFGRRGQGTGIGVAAAMKLTPATAGVYWLAKGNWRGVLTSAATFAVTVGLGFLVAPAASRQYWIDGLAFDASRIGGTAYLGNQSLAGFVIRWGGSPDAASVLRWVLSGLVLLIALVAAWSLMRRPHGEVRALGVVVLAGLLSSPITWTHHWVWWPVIAAAVWQTGSIAGAGWRRWCRAFVGVFSVVLLLGPVWWMPHGGDREFHRNLAQAVIGELYVELGLVALATLAIGAVLSVRSVPLPALSSPERQASR
jgi:alpha-1,2-mannosyltransferase